MIAYDAVDRIAEDDDVDEGGAVENAGDELEPELL